MKKAESKVSASASELITQRIAELSDWRGSTLAELRTLIHEAAPEIVEEWKWDTPAWSRNGLVCAAGVFKDHIRLNFFKGAALPDPRGLFNGGLEAKASRAIDFTAGTKLNAPALKALIRAAVALNLAPAKKK